MKIIPIFLLGIFYCSSLLSASFDCEKAFTSIEKQICDDSVLSKLDSDLGELYTSELVKDIQLKKQQREWLKKVRNTCGSYECLVKVYSDRIASLRQVSLSLDVGKSNDAKQMKAKKTDNFKISSNYSSNNLCSEYLKVINSIDSAELRSCDLPDLSLSPILPVKFQVLTGQELTKMGLLLFRLENRTEGKEWRDKWNERQEDYKTGYRRLSKLYWDYDEDGHDDLILQERLPWKYCTNYGRGLSDYERKKIKNDWAAMTKLERIESARVYGFRKDHYLVSNDLISYLQVDELINYENELYSIAHYGLARRASSTDWADRNWVRISSLKRQLNVSANRYESREICNYWFN